VPIEEEVIDATSDFEGNCEHLLRRVVGSIWIDTRQKVRGNGLKLGTATGGRAYDPWEPSEWYHGKVPWSEWVYFRDSISKGRKMASHR
jgi:hypothetical protein